MIESAIRIETLGALIEIRPCEECGRQFYPRDYAFSVMWNRQITCGKTDCDRGPVWVCERMEGK